MSFYNARGIFLLLSLPPVREFNNYQSFLPKYSLPYTLSSNLCTSTPYPRTLGVTSGIIFSHIGGNFWLHILQTHFHPPQQADFIFHIFNLYTMQPTYYNQVFNALDAWLNPKSRQSTLESYFSKYLPSFTSLFPQSVYGFIQWELTYEQLLTMFDSSIPEQKIRQRDKVYYYLKNDRKKWWDRSMPPIPEKYERIPLKQERIRFVEVFWPDIERPVDRVPGTIKRYKNRFEQFQEVWAW